MEESNDSSLKFGATGAVDGVGAERLPDDAFADIGGDEERDSRAQAVPLLQQFVQADDNDAGNEELHPRRSHCQNGCSI